MSPSMKKIKPMISIGHSIQNKNAPLNIKKITPEMCYTHGVNLVYGKCPVCSDIERTTDKI